MSSAISPTAGPPQTLARWEPDPGGRPLPGFRVAPAGPDRGTRPRPFRGPLRHGPRSTGRDPEADRSPAGGVRTRSGAAGVRLADRSPRRIRAHPPRRRAFNPAAPAGAGESSRAGAY